MFTSKLQTNDIRGAYIRRYRVLRGESGACDHLWNRLWDSCTVLRELKYRV